MGALEVTKSQGHKVTRNKLQVPGKIADSFLQEALTDLESKGLIRNLRQVEGAQGREISLDGRKLLNFCSNNYLGLADDPRLRQAAIDSITKEGLGSGASRLVCGNMASHTALEEKIARFKGAEGCLLFSSGYMANVGIISSLFDRGDIIFSDKLNHASIVDGILLSQAEFKRYPHNDMETLEGWLKNAQAYKKRAIITDSVFSMDGDIALLDRIVQLAEKYHALVMVDEAHAFGVLGNHGRGLVEHFGLEKSVDIQMGTLSKAAGSFGAYVCGSKTLISYLINRARSFIYTTAMPPAVAAASLRAIEIIESEPELRSRLAKNSRYMLEELKRMGFDTLESRTPIIPVVVKDSAKAVQFSQKLFEAGIFVQAIRPPTVPVHTARLRVTVMASHFQEDLEFALENFKGIGQELCLI